jgi:hypothetical protein
VDAGEELGPPGAGGGSGEGGSGFLVSASLGLLAGGFGALELHPLSSEVDDVGPEPGVGGEDAVVAVAVDAGWGDQTGEGVQKLEG